MRTQEAIEQIFGVRACSHALFYQRPGGLRFALSEGQSPLDQVLLALRIATAICTDLFEGSPTLTVCLRQFASPNPLSFRTTLRELAQAGIRIPREHDIWIEPTPPEDRFEDDTESWWLNVAFEISTAKLQNLLWCAIVSDFGSLHPNPQCRVYLVNLAEKVMAHPYDDRGMDVLGPNHALLAMLYARHNHRLLDYDRATMDATFAVGSQVAARI
jgi:hypothetical protein